MSSSVCVYCGGPSRNTRRKFTVCLGHLDLPDIDPYINDRILDRSEPVEYAPRIVNAALPQLEREDSPPADGTAA